MNPQFSIVIPAYKSDFLQSCIDSILRQTFQDFELIIVDDCSPNNLKDVVAGYSDKRISYIRNEKNLGGVNLVKQWNHCLTFAKGNYFVLASDDDVYDRDFLQQINVLSNKYPEVEVLHSRVNIIDSVGNLINVSASAAEWESALSFVWHRICKFREQFMPEFVFKTNALRAAGGFVEFPCAWGSDHATTFKLAQKHGVACTSDALFSWRSSGLNISGKGNHTSQKILAIFEYLAWTRDFVSQSEFDYDLDLKPLVLDGLKHYHNKRFPTLLSELSVFQLCMLIVRGNLFDQKVNRTLGMKAILIKIFK